uniref:Ciliary neurotrophic factor n=1 Tax=Paramormyrops kingsleyae TaxID=1676925 RepID=A0A3B3QMC6_9TELE
MKVFFDINLATHWNSISLPQFMVMNLRSRRSLSAAGGSSAECELPGLADLLEKACTRLLELYKEKESFTSDITLTKDRIITLPPTSPHLSADDRLWILHSALHQCLEFLETVMRREEEEFGIQVGGDYRKMQNIVKARLGDLLQSMKLLTRGERVTALASHTESTDGSENGNIFALKVWIYRVLQELMHWIKCASETLLTLQSERETEESDGTRFSHRGKVHFVTHRLSVIGSSLERV